MKAATINAFGSPSVLQFQDVPTPSITPDQVLVKVEACGVNRLDLMIRSGAFADIPLPHVMGSEVAGTVEAIGETVTGIQVGSSVVVAPWLICGRCKACLRGFESVCEENGQILGVRSWGGYGEYVAVSGLQIVDLPSGVDLGEAAALTLSGLTAWHLLVTRANLEPGETVLIQGANSGIGSLGVEIAKLVGATVIATVSTDAKRKLARDIGADFVIDSSNADWPSEVKRITRERGVDVVMEHIGQSTWPGSFASLAPRGRIVTCGATTGAEVQLDTVDLYYTELNVLGSRGGTRAELATLMDLLGKKRISPVIDSRIELGDAYRAHERLESREQFGKILLIP